MMSPLKIQCMLNSPLCGKPPALDALLEWELGCRIGMSHKITRDKPLNDDEIIPIPLSKKKSETGRFFWAVSDPIMPRHKTIHTEYAVKKFESSDSLLVAPEFRKSVLTSSGPYKSRRAPMMIRRIESIVWFAHGDRREIKKLLKKITSVGKNRNIGYGIVLEWKIEEVEKDYSVMADKILMRTIPIIDAIKMNASGYVINYGGFRPPYWHPDNYIEIAIPC